MSSIIVGILIMAIGVIKIIKKVPTNDPYSSFHRWVLGILIILSGVVIVLMRLLK